MTLTEYAMRFIGRPYIWGGDGTGKTNYGFDCSGLVLEVLKAYGKYTGGDTTADGLLKWCRKNKHLGNSNDKEVLLFFGTKSKATHVALSIGGGLMLEAGGGGSSCKTPSTSTGSVRIRPVNSRKDILEAWAL